MGEDSAVYRSNGQTGCEKSMLPMSLVDLSNQTGGLRQFVVDGLFRSGETVNVIGAPKAGKSFLLMQMLLSIASGRDWLGRATLQGPVLLIDNELHRETLLDRFKRVANAMAIDFDAIDFDVTSLRGQLRDIDWIQKYVSRLAKTYCAIGIDAFYRTLPKGISESDNAQMASVYNLIDLLASNSDAAIILNHHASKGEQGQKNVTDVGSGAGVISRAADCHLIIRRHELPTAAVLEGVTRSSASPPAQTICWNFPLWSPSEIKPVVGLPISGVQRRQSKNDQDADSMLLELLSKGGKTKSQLRTCSGYGDARVARAITRLVKGDAIRERRVRNKHSGRKSVKYELIPK